MGRRVTLILVRYGRYSPVFYQSTLRASSASLVCLMWRQSMATLLYCVGAESSAIRLWNWWCPRRQPGPGTVGHGESFQQTGDRCAGEGEHGRIRFGTAEKSPPAVSHRGLVFGVFHRIRRAAVVDADGKGGRLVFVS